MNQQMQLEVNNDAHLRCLFCRKPACEFYFKLTNMRHALHSSCAEHFVPAVKKPEQHALQG